MVKHYCLSILGLSLIATANAQEITFSKFDAKLSDYGYVYPLSLWNQPIVPVCFENPAPQFEKQMRTVEISVQNSWERNSGLQFTGWKGCDDYAAGIRILISDDKDAPQSLYGNSLAGTKSGMRLNFTFKNWGENCQGREQDCIVSIAVHEFGHAIGFVHESLRSDAPENCKNQSDVLTDKSHPLGETNQKTTYDALSVMNYCNRTTNSRGELSELDILAVQKLYPKVAK